MQFKIIERMFFVMKKGVKLLVGLVGLFSYVIYGGMEDENFHAEGLEEELVFFEEDAEVVVQGDEGILEAPQVMNANEGSVPNTGSEEALDTEEDTQIVEEVVEAEQPTQQEQEQEEVQAQAPTPAPVQNNTQSQAQSQAPAPAQSTVQAPASNNQAEVQAQKERERAMAEEQAERLAKEEAEAIKKAKAEAEAAAKAAAEAARPKYAPNSVYVNGAKVPGSVNGNVVTGINSSVMNAGSVMITDGSGNGRTVSLGAQYEVSKVDNRTFDTDEDMTAILQGSYGVVFIESINSYVNLVAQGY